MRIIRNKGQNTVVLQGKEPQICQMCGKSGEYLYWCEEMKTILCFNCATWGRKHSTKDHQDVKIHAWDREE